MANKKFKLIKNSKGNLAYIPEEDYTPLVKQIAKRNKEVKINGGSTKETYQDPRDKYNNEEIKLAEKVVKKEHQMDHNKWGTTRENEYEYPQYDTGTRSKTNTNMGKENPREEYRKKMDMKMLQHHGQYDSWEPTETNLEQHNFLEENMNMDQYTPNFMKPAHQSRDLPLEPEKNKFHEGKLSRNRD